MIYDDWFNGLSTKDKAKVMEDRMTRMETYRQTYMPVNPARWWNAKNSSQKSDIYTRLNAVYPRHAIKPVLPKKNRSKSKNMIKRSDKQ